MKKMTKFNKVLLAGGITLAVLVPTTAALADSGGFAHDGRGNGQPCDNDQAMDQVRAQDGTGWRHTLADGTTVVVPNANGAGHQSGPMDGSGPRADPPMDGSGNQIRSGG